MDSKRLFIFIALWLFLSCVLLDHAEGFIIPRRRRRWQGNKGGPNNHLSRRKREMAGFMASHIWVCISKTLILQRQSLSVIYNLEKLKECVSRKQSVKFNTLLKKHHQYIGKYKIFEVYSSGHAHLCYSLHNCI